jgi:TonB family protein
MLHFWVQSSARSTLFSPSAAISLAAHLVLGGAALYGTLPSSHTDEPRPSQPVLYFAPPDRQPGRTKVEEHLRFVEVGVGVRADGSPAPNGVKRGVSGAEASRMSSPGRDLLSEQAQVAVPSNDSVYSVLTVDEAAVRMEGSAAPVYPSELIKQGVEGSVTIRYVIDSTGRAEPTSIEVSTSTHPLFTEAVRDAIPRMLFNAATVAGRPVRQLVEQSFAFRITPPVPAPSEHTRTNTIP